MSRTVSSRLPKELHEELRERCNKLGESMNDYIKAAIEFALWGSTDFDLGESEDEIDESQNQALKPAVISIE